MIGKNRWGNYDDEDDSRGKWMLINLNREKKNRFEMLPSEIL